MSLSSTVEAGTEIGWTWLAKLTGSISATVGGNIEESKVREKILSSPSPQHLVPALKHLPITLVVEDFHYLTPDTQKTIFQSWKAFVDNQVTVIVVGTTHHAVDIANSNKDLVGRIAHIESTTWNPNDLSKIIEKGFDFLGIRKRSEVLNVVPKESAGLPIIVQQVCAQLIFNEIGFELPAKNPKMGFSESDVREALNHVATRRYNTMKTYYETLIHGPRKRARKYDTYALILACFTIGDLKFSLSRYEIDDRLQKLPIGKSDIPPTASVNSTLGALEKFQKRRNIELLEWMPQTKTLYILELAFLFYLRWRRIEEKPKQLELFMSILNELVQTEFSPDEAPSESRSSFYSH